MNGIDRLIDQILSTKSESFSERIGEVVNKHMGIEEAKPTELQTDTNSESNEKQSKDTAALAEPMSTCGKQNENTAASVETMSCCGSSGPDEASLCSKDGCATANAPMPEPVPHAVTSAEVEGTKVIQSSEIKMRNLDYDSQHVSQEPEENGKICKSSMVEDQAVLERVECITSPDVGCAAGNTEQKLKLDNNNKVPASAKRNEGTAVGSFCSKSDSNKSEGTEKCDATKSNEVEKESYICRSEVVKNNPTAETAPTNQHGSQQNLLERNDSRIVEDRNTLDGNEQVSESTVRDKPVLDELCDCTSKGDEVESAVTSKQFGNDTRPESPSIDKESDKNKFNEDVKVRKGFTEAIQNSQVKQSGRYKRLKSDPENYAVKIPAKLRTRRSVSQDGTCPHMSSDTDREVLLRLRLSHDNNRKSSESSLTGSESDTSTRNSKDKNNEEIDVDEVFLEEETTSINKSSNTFSAAVERPSTVTIQTDECSLGNVDERNAVESSDTTVTLTGMAEYKFLEETADTECSSNVNIEHTVDKHMKLSSSKSDIEINSTEELQLLSENQESSAIQSSSGVLLPEAVVEEQSIYVTQSSVSTSQHSERSSESEEVPVQSVRQILESQTESSESEALQPRRSRRGRKRRRFFDSEGSESDNTAENKSKTHNEMKDYATELEVATEEERKTERPKLDSVERGRGRRKKREVYDINETVVTERKTRKSSEVESVSDNQSRQDTVTASRPRRQIRPKRCYSPSEGK